MAIMRQFCSYKSRFLGDPSKVREELISSFGVLLLSPDAFKLIDLVLFALKFMSWETPPFPRLGFQVAGTIHPAPCLFI